MKKVFFLSTLIIISFLSFSQPTIQWQKSLGGSGYDWALSIQQTTDGGFIVAGESTSNDGNVTGNHGNEDFWVVKLNNQGNIQWQKSLGGSGYDKASTIQQTSDGGYIVAGESTSNDGDVTGNHGDSDYWVVKLDSLGNLQWQKSLGGTGYDRAWSIQQTTDGGYIVAGWSNSNDGDVTGNHGGSDYWVVKLDSLGNPQWQKSLGGSGSDEANSTQQTSDGGFIVAGWTDSNDGDVTGQHGTNDYWVVKLDSLGTLQWQKSLGGSFDDGAWSIQQTADGGYIVAGWSESNDGDVSGNHGGYDYWVVKLGSQGNIQWQKSLGGSLYDIAYSIKQTADGGYVLAGWSHSHDGDVTGVHGFEPDYWVVKLDSLGNLQWQKSLGGVELDVAYSIQQTTDGGYIVGGVSFSYDGDVTGNHGNTDYWVVKLSPLTGIEELNAAGIAVYPNPANDVITITSLKEIGEVKIYDVVGKLIYEELHYSLSAGIDIQFLSPGIYIIDIMGYRAKITKQ